MTALLLLIARIQVPERTTEPAASPDPSLAPQFT
jgi:hypothetical protein